MQYSSLLAAAEPGGCACCTMRALAAKKPTQEAEDAKHAAAAAAALSAEMHKQIIDQVLRNVPLSYEQEECDSDSDHEVDADSANSVDNSSAIVRSTNDNEPPESLPLYFLPEDMSCLPSLLSAHSFLDFSQLDVTAASLIAWSPGVVAVDGGSAVLDAVEAFMAAAESRYRRLDVFTPSAALISFASSPQHFSTLPMYHANINESELPASAVAVSAFFSCQDDSAKLIAYACSFEHQWATVRLDSGRRLQTQLHANSDAALAFMNSLALRTGESLLSVRVPVLVGTMERQ
jgi:hypothetical protein